MGQAACGVARTTRSCRPTAAGERFYERIRTVLADIDLARNEVVASAVEIDGRLRIGAPSQFGVRHLVPALAAFMARYPALNVELVLSDQLADLQAAGLDLVLRFGHPADSTLRQHRLGTVRRVIYGAPGYFAQHGRPLHPGDLRRHECIVRTGVRGAETWRFHDKQGALAVRVNGRFRSDSIAACCEAAIQGVGVGRGLLLRGVNMSQKPTCCPPRPDHPRSQSAVPPRSILQQRHSTQMSAGEPDQ